MQAHGYPWVLDVGSNLGLCGLPFALVHHTRNSMLEQDPICAWTIENDQHQFLNDLGLPKQVWANPFQVVWCRLWECKCVVPMYLSEYSAFHLRSVHCLTRMSCSDKSLRSFRAAGTKGCLDCSLTLEAHGESNHKTM